MRGPVPGFAPEPLQVSHSSITGKRICFSVPRAADVTVAVYNLAGEKIATLASGTLTPGNYSVKWDATNVASGMYFYRMTATSNGTQSFTMTKKMTLVK